MIKYFKIMITYFNLCLAYLIVCFFILLRFIFFFYYFESYTRIEWRVSYEKRVNKMLELYLVFMRIGAILTSVVGLSVWYSNPSKMVSRVMWYSTTWAMLFPSILILGIWLDRLSSFVSFFKLIKVFNLLILPIVWVLDYFNFSSTRRYLSIFLDYIKWRILIGITLISFWSFYSFGPHWYLVAGRVTLQMTKALLSEMGQSCTGILILDFIKKYLPTLWTFLYRKGLLPISCIREIMGNSFSKELPIKNGTLHINVIIVGGENTESEGVPSTSHPSTPTSGVGKVTIDNLETPRNPNWFSRLNLRFRRVLDNISCVPYCSKDWDITTPTLDSNVETSLLATPPVAVPEVKLPEVKLRDLSVGRIDLDSVTREIERQELEFTPRVEEKIEVPRRWRRPLPYYLTK